MRPSVPDVGNFWKKRLLRILPLLWLVTLVSIVLFGPLPDATKLFLNLSGLFGFLQWDKYILPGAWSIGNELVFYAFFPVFVFLIKKARIVFMALSIIIFCIYLYFSFHILGANIEFAEQWKSYINPLNQVLYFLGGYLIGFIFLNTRISKPANTLILLFGVSLFVFYPVKGSITHIIIGFNRIVFTLSCFLICLSFFKTSYKLPKQMHKILVKLGESSYSVYLIHPLVYKAMGIGLNISGVFTSILFDVGKLFLSMLLTLVISYYIYEYYEKYFIGMGRRKNFVKSSNLNYLTAST